jgi:hypothetical protein
VAENPRQRVSTCTLCGDPTAAKGVRGPIPKTCPKCESRRRAVRYVRAAARIAYELGDLVNAAALDHVVARMRIH